jgi:microcompartment protein CcmK/EutM
MQFAKIIGQVIATRKEGNIESRRLLVARLLDGTLAATGKELVCIDAVSAKTGDVVLVCNSSSARFTSATRGTCADCTVVGIVDRISASQKDWYEYGRQV